MDAFPYHHLVVTYYYISGPAVGKVNDITKCTLKNSKGHI